MQRRLRKYLSADLILRQEPDDEEDDDEDGKKDEEDEGDQGYSE